MYRVISEHEFSPDSIPTEGTFEGLISDCLQGLDSTSAGTAIYLLNCLCPDDFAVVLDLVRLDLSRPLHHKCLREPRVLVISNSYADAISRQRAYAHAFPTQVYDRLWLPVTQCWLLTCPLDRGYYQPNESAHDTFCQQLRSDLVERILGIDGRAWNLFHPGSDLEQSHESQLLHPRGQLWNNQPE